MSFPETHSPETGSALLPALQGQPIERVQRDGVEYVVLGTAHVSKVSVDAVDALLANEHFDAVAADFALLVHAGDEDAEGVVLVVPADQCRPLRVGLFGAV